MFRVLAVVVALGLTLAGCSPTGIVTSKGISVEERQSLAIASRDWRVADVRVVVPAKLVVSEANVYYPIADIVWRGDPIGDRYEQVAAIFETSVTRGVQHLRGSRPVLLDISVTRFHSLTEKTRYSVGGTHSISYFMTVRDPSTKNVLAGPVLVRADIKAVGGQEALMADAKGETQKKVILEHLEQTTRNFLPGHLTGS